MDRRTCRTPTRVLIWKDRDPEWIGMEHEPWWLGATCPHPECVGHEYMVTSPTHEEAVAKIPVYIETLASHGIHVTHTRTRSSKELRD